MRSFEAKHLTVASNLNGEAGAFPNTLPLTGTYSISRGSEYVDGEFTLRLPITAIGGYFPRDEIYLDNYPNSVRLEGYGRNWAAAVVWGTQILERDERAIIYDGELAGFPCLLELKTAYFNRKDSASVLAAVPLFAPSDVGDFNDDGATDGLDLLAYQRANLLEPYQERDLQLWERHFGARDFLPANGTIAPEPHSCISAFLVLIALRLRPNRSFRDPRRA